ncbi:MAG TPA: hypothetical protein VIG33_11995 [Pseudobdellovibrionaceae bacterium]
MKLVGNGKEVRRCTTIDGASFIVSEFRKPKKLEEWQLGILELPVKSYKADDAPILVLQNNGTARSLSSTSHLIGSVTDIVEKMYFLRIDSNINETQLIKKLENKHYLMASEPQN